MIHDYIGDGYAIVPIPRGEKAPRIAEWQNRQFTADDFGESYNVGIKTGSVSGGLIDVDLDAKEAVYAADAMLPKTGMVSGRAGKPRSHWWYVCPVPPKTTKFADTDGKMLVELRSDGCQTIVPRSVHPSGEDVVWEETSDPATIDAADLHRHVAELAAMTLLVRHWPNEGNRQNAAMALAGGLLRHGWDVPRVEAFLRILCGLCNDEETDKRVDCVKGTAATLQRGEPCTGFPKLAEIVGGDVIDLACKWLDVGGADADDTGESFNDPIRIARVFRDTKYPNGTLRYWGKDWWGWTGRKYRNATDEDIRLQLVSLVKDEFDRHHAKMKAAADREYKEAKIAYDAAVRQGVQGIREPKPPRVRPAMHVTAGFVNDVMLSLKSLTCLGSDVEQPSFIGDPDTKYVAMNNGLLNLDKLLAGDTATAPHSPLWFSPVCLPYDYDPAATCPKWESHLNKVLGDAESVALLQEWIGYCLTSSTDLQKFLLMVGDGRNGKSVICAGIIAMLGEENVSSVALEDFGQRFSLVQTLGKAANVTSEIGDLDKIAERQLKQYVDGSMMAFERKHRDAINARPTAKLIFSTNNFPRFLDKSDGLWRRLILLRFTVQIMESETVVGMDKPAWWIRNGEVPGVFNWAIAGLKRLLKSHRFTIPETCKRAIQEYRGECNPAADFLESCYTIDPTGYVDCRSLFDQYRCWCVDRNYQPLNDTTFGREVIRKFPKACKHRLGSASRRYVYQGIAELAAPAVLRTAAAS